MPGGTIKSHETPEEAVARELQEELNLVVTVRQQLYEVPMRHETGVEFGLLVDLPSSLPALGIDSAVVDWAWHSLDNIDDIWQATEVKKAISLNLL